MNRLGKRAPEDDDITGILVYMGFVVGAGIAGYLAPRPGVTRSGEMPSVEPPLSFDNLADVALRFDEVKTLYRSGVLDFQGARDQLSGLIDAAFRLETQGLANASETAVLAQAMSEFYEDTLRAEGEIARTNQAVV